MDQQRILEDVLKWAWGDDNIRLVVLTGSMAQGASDELSDLDLELYVWDPTPLLEREDWYKSFGQVLVVEELDNPGWHPTRLVYYVDGKVDFMIASTEAARTGVSYTRPFRVLVDKDELGAHLHRVIQVADPPTAAEWNTCINWFYAGALMCAKCIVRDEPWMAKFRDWDLKIQLLRMIEWDHKSRYGWDYDTWHRGVHMRHWMDTEIITALERCWAGFTKEQMTSALIASVELFERLMGRTADCLRVAPFDSSAVRREIDRLLARSPAPAEENQGERRRL